MTEPPDELTDEQIAELRQELERLRDELQQALDGASKSSTVVGLDQPIGRVSRQDALQQQQMAKANRRNVEIRLAQVRQALALVQSGDYGYCRRCEEPIGYGRLRSRPEAPFCMECQRTNERR
jgi:DnaK suppressor protein